MKKPDLKNILGHLKGSFTTRSFRVGGYSVAATAIVLAIIIAVNIFIQALPAELTQFDTSANQLFSVSEQTEKILAALEQDVTIYWIVQAGYEDSTIQTLLSRYEAIGDRVSIQKKDPDVYPTFTQNYTTGQVYNNSLVVTCGERYRYVDYYDIYLLDSSDYYYTGSYSYTFAGENALTSAIDYVVSEDLPKLYTLIGHGEAALSTTYQEAIDSENITTAELSLLTVEAVPEDADLILICGPQSDISESERDKLLAYLQTGGNLLLISDPPQEGALTNLEALMAEYGVTASQGVVIEGNQSYYIWGTPYYLLPEMDSHAITDPLIESGYHVLMPIAQGLNISNSLRDTLTVTDLLSTSSDAYSKVAGYSLTTYEKEEGDIDGPFSLAVAITDYIDGENETNIVWVASSALVDEDTNYQVSGGNLDLFLNAISWMCEQEDRISIHAKSLDYEYLTMDSGTASTLTVLLVGIIPLAYLAIGITTWIRRKRR